MSLGLLNARLPTSRPSCHVMWPHGEGSQGTGIQENVMSSEMLSADKYLSIVNDLLRFLESRGELKGSSPVRRGAVGNTGYAVRWPPTRLMAPLDAMAQDEVDGSNQVELAFEAIDFANYPDLLSINGRQTDVTWQAVTVDLDSSWSYTMPDVENWYYIHLRGQNSGGNEADAETVWHGLIDHVPPTITASGAQSGVEGSGETVYTFTINDFLLDSETAVYPCGSPEITTQTYNNSDAPFDGFAYEISGTCSVDELQTSGTFSICDVAGHCVTEVVTPTMTSDVGAIRIITPTTSITSTVSGVAVEIAGLAIAANEVQTVTIAVDNTPVQTITYGAGITTTNWSTSEWMPTVSGLYTITAVLTDYNLNTYHITTLTITVSFTPDADDKLCRYTGSGWDCVADSFDAGNQTITRNNVTQFSPWAVGNNVGPTAVNLRTFTASTSNQIWIWLIVLLIGIMLFAILWQHKTKRRYTQRGHKVTFLPE